MTWKKTLGLFVLPGGALLAGGYLAYRYYAKKKIELINEEKLNAAQKKWMPKIKEWADKLGLNPYYFAALVEQESSYNPKAFRREEKYKWGKNPDFPTGDASYGLVQILYSTAAGMGFKGKPNDLFNVDTNLQWGGKFLKTVLKKSGGNWPDALARYNSGKPFDNDGEIDPGEHYANDVKIIVAKFKTENIFPGATV